MKKYIKNRVYPPIYDLLKYWYFKLLKGSFYAKDELDKKLLKYINYKNGFYVELGANNGFSQSNTLYFELKKEWRGILIEPSPNLYLQCCYFRNNNTNKIFCNACVDFDYDRKYVDISYGDLMTISESIDLEIPNGQQFYEKRNMHIDRHHTFLKFGSIAATLDSILNKSEAPKVIDLLSVDVEGAELSVLSGIDFENYQFNFILVETRSPQKVKEFLLANGYDFVENLSNHDLLFRKIESVQV